MARISCVLEPLLGEFVEACMPDYLRDRAVYRLGCRNGFQGARLRPRSPAAVFVEPRDRSTRRALRGYIGVVAAGAGSSRASVPSRHRVTLAIRVQTGNANRIESHTIG